METAAGTSSAGEDFLEWLQLACIVGNALFGDIKDFQCHRNILDINSHGHNPGQ